jgi:uncharacterized protein
MSALTSEDAAQALCKACGLCCNGVWFSTGNLETDEIERAEQEGFRLRRTAAGPRFVQPCHKYQNGCCSAYTQWRPSVCNSYTCALLNRVLQGQMSSDEAVRHVAAARTMADRVMQETGPIEDGLAGQSFVRWLADAPLPTDPPRLPLSPVAKMDAVALRVYFERHFKQSDKSADSGQEPGAYLTHDKS